MDRPTLLHILSTSPRAVCVALTTLHARQTADEQRGRATTHRNARGFNAFDAPRLSLLASYAAAESRLTAHQLSEARRALRKYAEQLLASGIDWTAFRGGFPDPGELRAMEALAMELQEAST